MTTTWNRVTRRLVPALALAALVAGGCAPPRYPVSGKVVFDDGSPLAEGSVIGEATIDGKKVLAQGEVKPDGTFNWGSSKAGEGARPGKYRVIVAPRALGDAEIAEGKIPAVDAKFTAPETSGIDFEVKESPTNELKITVTRPAPQPAPEPKPAEKKDPDTKADPAEKKDPPK
jgi:hypothetical protein